MSVIKITVNDQALYVTDKPVIASQGVNENYIQCTFSPDWADFGVIALFYKEDNETEVYESVVSGDGKALIPYEVTQTPGRICIGLAGVKNDIVHTSEILKYKIVKGLYTEGEHSEPPSPGIYEQMLALAGQMREAFNTAVTTQGAAIEQIRAEQTALRSELTTEQETFEDRITGQVDTFVAGHSGTYGQTTLWTSPDANGIIGKDATVTLSEPIESYDYVDIYSFNGDKNEIATIPVDDILLQGEGYTVRTVNVSTGTVKMDIVESRITIVGTVFTIANEYIYQAGQSNPVHQITQDNKSPHIGAYGITKVVGRKLVENAEVADIRVGADGTVYQSAGAAVRGQITGVKAQIPLIDASLATAGKAADAKAVGDELTGLNGRLVDNGIAKNVFVANPDKGQITNAQSKGVTVTFSGNAVTLNGTSTAAFSLFVSGKISPVSGTMYERIDISDESIAALNLGVREGWFDANGGAHQFSSDIYPTNKYVEIAYPTEAVTSRTILNIPSGATFSDVTIKFYLGASIPLNEQIDSIKDDLAEANDRVNVIFPKNNFILEVSPSQKSNALSKGITVSTDGTAITLSGTANSDFNINVAFDNYYISHPEYERITDPTENKWGLTFGFGYYDSASAAHNFTTFKTVNEFVKVDFPEDAVKSRVYVKIPAGSVFDNDVLSFESLSAIPTLDKIESFDGFIENIKGQSWNSAFHDGLSEYKDPCQRFSMLMSGDTINNVPAVSVCESFIFFTDPHLAFSYGDNGVLENYMGQLEKVYNSTPTSFVIDGGDWLGNSYTPEQASYSMGLIDGIRKSMLNPCYPLVGNHDTNYQGKKDSSSDTYTTRFPIDAIKNFWFRKWNKTYYKFNGSNTTFYCFDTQSGYGDTDDSNFIIEQIEWFAEDLLSSDANHIGLAMHIYFGTAEMTVPSTFASAVMPIAAAFNKRESVEYNGVTYNYANATGEVNFVLTGHTHVDGVRYYTTGGVSIPILVTVDMGYHATYPDNASFDLVFVDYDNRQIKCVRVGSGADRTIPFSV